MVSGMNAVPQAGARWHLEMAVERCFSETMRRRSWGWGFGKLALGKMVKS